MTEQLLNMSVFTWALIITNILTTVVAISIVWRTTVKLRQQLELEQLTLSERERLYKLQEQFIVILAHELRTPLTTIIGYTNLILEDDANIVDYVGGIQRGSLRLQLLVDQAVVSLRLKIDPQPFNIAESIKALITRYEVWAATHKKPYTFVINYNGQDDLIVEGDVFMLETAILELVRNGVKAVQVDNSDPSINVYAERLNGNYMISVSDNGIGMPKDMLNSLFSRHALDYADVSDIRSWEGVRLGLSVVRHVVNLHNGNIEVESVEGEGTTVYIILPVVSDEL